MRKALLFFVGVEVVIKHPVLVQTFGFVISVGVVAHSFNLLVPAADVLVHIHNLSDFHT